jgi:glycosyltransferase involved in cell wall biosynthesis
MLLPWVSAAPRRRGENAGVIRVLLLGPARWAPSGVATHVNRLFESKISTQFALSRFQVGSEGRRENPVSAAIRLMISPITFVAQLVRVRPHIVHINTSFDSKAYWRDVLYLMIAKALRRRVVYQVHGGALPADFFPRSRVLTAFLRRVLSWGDAVVVLAACELTAYREFAPRVHLVRIANGVPACTVDLSAARYLADRPLAMVYLGRLAASKGILDAVDAVALLRKRDVPVRLTIAGSGPAEGPIQQAIDTRHLADRVHLMGEVFGEAKLKLWREADVFVLPTEREGLPYALLESMACGVVPVVSPVGGIPDVVQHGVHGLLVPSRSPPALADALERLARDRNDLYRMAVAAHAQVTTQYSMSRVEEEFMRLYYEVMGCDY